MCNTGEPTQASCCYERRMGRGTNRSYSSDGGATTHAPPVTTTGDRGCVPRRKGYASDSSQGTRDGDWPATMTSLAGGAQFCAVWASEPDLSEPESRSYTEPCAHAPMPSPPPPPPPTGLTFITSDGHRWQELWSEADQYTYYLQTATGHTQWEEPRPVAPLPPPPLPAPMPVSLHHHDREDRGRGFDPEILQARVPAREPSPMRRSLSGGPLVTVDDGAPLRPALSESPSYDRSTTSAYKELCSQDDDEKDIDQFFCNLVSPSNEGSRSPPASPVPRASVDAPASAPETHDATHQPHCQLSPHQDGRRPT